MASWPLFNGLFTRTDLPFCFQLGSQPEHTWRLKNHPRECQLLICILKRTEKSLWDTAGFCWLDSFPPTCTSRRFIMFLGIQFCISLLPFVILPVLIPKHPSPILHHVSSKSTNKASFAFPCGSVSRQPVKQHFSRALQSKTRVHGLDLHQKNENYSKLPSF